ncbi:MAG: MFS transporter [Pelolinea sp.]|nr:MFS transporter [Pelolinea sp.]
MRVKLRSIAGEYPRHFWVLIGALFIDRVGGALIFPFLSLYITNKFGVGMTEVGGIFAIHSISSFFGNMVGGALADKFGRRSMLIIGLIFSALISLGMGLIEDWELFYLLAFLTGFVANFGGPAVQAMLADILPIEKRPDGFGILRVAMNLAATIGPAIGGVLAGISYLLLFVIDCVVSMITAVIVYFALPETKPLLAEGKKEESVIQTIGGYGKVFKDKIFLALLFLTTFTAIVYFQMNTTLAVYLRDFHGISSQGFGFILSLNAACVVLFQFRVTRKVKKHHQLSVMLVGNLFYAVGFALYGFTNKYWQFLVAMVIITVGEMVIAPIVQTLIANISPEDMRGRYMAAYHLGWGIAVSIGPLAAGIIIDNYNPNWVWYAGGIICSLVAVGYFILKDRIGERLAPIS